MSDEAQESGRPVRRPLTAQALRLANRIHTTCKQLGRSDLAERITVEAARWEQQQLVVVAAGDIKRGKSSLLNAVLGRNGLLPVDADVATSVHLVVRYGPALEVSVTRIDENGTTVVEHVDAADLVDVASMRGAAARREGVTHVEIVIDHPLLASGVVLVDTPGVGGMSRGHRDLALAALARADALLFTVSASEPVARTELAFLAEASERIEHVVFAMTKADVNTDEINAAMLAEHRAKLATYLQSLRAAAEAERQRDPDEALERRTTAIRFAHLVDAPTVLTSAFLAEQAARRAEAGRAEQAARLRERSGVDRLTHLLERSAAKREEVRVANLLQLLLVLIGDCEREQIVKVRALSGDMSAAAELADRQRQLEDFASKQARWRTALGTAIVRLQTQSGRSVTRELTKVRNRYKELLDGASDLEAVVASLPSDLERSLHGAWNELVAAVNTEFSTALAAVLADLDLQDLDATLGTFEMPDSLAEVANASVGAQVERTLLDDGLPIAMQTFTFANIANAAAGALGLATGGLGLLAYGIGAAVSYRIGGMRRRQREQQRALGDAQRLVGEVLFGQEGIAKEFSTELSLRILDVREAVERSIEDRVNERRKQLEREQRELQGLAKAEAAKRHEAKVQADGVLADLGKLRAEIAPLQAAVAREMAGAPAPRPGAPDANL